MPSKYPSVTAAKVQPRPKPANFPTGKPRPRPRPMPPLKPLALGKVTVGRLNPAHNLISTYIAIGEMYHEWLYPDLVHRTARRVDLSPRYWIHRKCGDAFLGGVGCFSETLYRAGSVLGSGCGVTCATGRYNGSPSLFTSTPPNPTSVSVIYTYGDTGVVPGPGLIQVRREGSFHRVSGAPVPTPTRTYELAPGPMTAPLSVPIAWPNLAPRPVPYEKPRPQARPRPRQKPGARPRPVSIGKVPPLLHVGNAAEDQEHPLVLPSVVIGGRGGRVTVRTGRDYARPSPPKPPKPGSKPVKQHKIRNRMVRAAIGIVWGGINTATEAMDFIVAMHKSIKDPKYKLSPKASKAQVIEYMLTNFDAWGHIDPAEALQNYINMQVSDYLAAIGSGGVKNLSQQLGIATGLDRAVNQGRNYEQEFERGGGEVTDWTFVPTLDIDAETGAVTVTGPVGSLTWNLDANSITFEK